MSENELQRTGNQPGANDASTETSLISRIADDADRFAVADANAPSDINPNLHKLGSDEETTTLNDQISSYLNDVSQGEGLANPDGALEKYPALKAYRANLENSVFNADGTLKDKPDLKAAAALVDLNNAQIYATRQGMGVVLLRMGNVAEVGVYGGDTFLKGATSGVAAGAAAAAARRG